MIQKNDYWCGWLDSSVYDGAHKIIDWFCSSDLLVSCADSIRPPVPECLRSTERLHGILGEAMELAQFCYWIPRDFVRTVYLADFLFSGFCEVVLFPPSTTAPKSIPPVGFTSDAIRFDQGVPEELITYLETVGARGALGDGIGSGLNFALRENKIAQTLITPGDPSQ